MTSQSDLHEAARAYAEHGWPVFPLKPRDKRPATENGFKDATTNLTQIDRWWSAHPGYNIGLPTGLAFDVLDLDGEIALERARAFPDFPPGYRHPGPVSLTGRGWHLLFAPTGRKNGANLLRPPHDHIPNDCTFPNCESKIDFRGTGGYIAAPPSVHPFGHLYTWAEGRDWQLHLPAAPDWLIAMLDYRGIEARREHERPSILKRNSAVRAAFADDHVDPRDLPPTLRQRATRPDIYKVAEELGLPIHWRTKYAETTCIFHDDHSPSLALWPDNRFNCWSCGAKGDSWDLQKRQAMNI